VGRRPAVVPSPHRYHAKVGLVVPVTSAVEDHRFEVPLPAGLPLRGVILADQVRSLDWRVRRAGLACPLPDDVTLAVPQKPNMLVGV
jgi:mRNA interferase MazF